MKTFKDYLEYPLAKGSVLGASVMVAVTPGLNYVSSILTGNPMPWSRPFTGCVSLAAAGTVNCATTFTIKSLLGGDAKDASDGKRFFTSFMAGMASGLTTCSLESVALNQLSTKTSMMQTARTMHQHYGFAGFFRGANGMMAREGGWASMYMAAVPILSQRFKEAGCNRATAEGAALVISAGLFGVLSAPVNRLRIMKQEKLAEAGTPKTSYRQLVAKMIEPDATAAPAKRIAGFFKGCGARSLTSALAGGLFFKGSEAFDEVVQRMKQA